MSSPRKQYVLTWAQQLNHKTIHIKHIKYIGAVTCVWRCVNLSVFFCVTSKKHACNTRADASSGCQGFFCVWVRSPVLNKSWYCFQIYVQCLLVCVGKTEYDRVQNIIVQVVRAWKKIVSVYTAKYGRRPACMKSAATCASSSQHVPQYVRGKTLDETS